MTTDETLEEMIRPHFLSNGKCVPNCGVLVSGSRALAREFVEKYMGGRRSISYSGVCPRCGERYIVKVYLSHGGGEVRFRVWGLGR
ncbi:MAG: hypothetical protein JRD89_05075 [Deltaproteobacteria bacterium]|nr:hypothetical protein [Deltaproteobacteria bacterium]